ncbi:Cupredoxin [Xylogone sp. PMI_703]|nr:Cupredoxin [Xylogone sp. PMI_703]
MYRSVASLVAVAAAVNAATIDINVGQTGLSFSPNSVTAQVGDVLQFHFFPGGHSVVQGDFANPCQPSSSSAFFSGNLPGDSSGNNVFLVTVTSTDPIWYYCSAPGHCPAGMVGVVNPPANQTIGAFRSAAQNADSVSAPSSVQGGTVTTAGAAPSTAAPGTSTVPAQTSTVTAVTTVGSNSTVASQTPSNTGTAPPATSSPGAASRLGDFSVLLGLAVIGSLVGTLA